MKEMFGRKNKTKSRGKAKTDRPKAGRSKRSRRTKKKERNDARKGGTQRAQQAIERDMPAETVPSRKAGVGQSTIVPLKIGKQQKPVSNKITPSDVAKDWRNKK